MIGKTRKTIKRKENCTSSVVYVREVSKSSQHRRSLRASTSPFCLLPVHFDFYQFFLCSTSPCGLGHDLSLWPWGHDLYHEEECSGSVLLHDTDSDCSLIGEQGAARLRPGRRLPLNLALVKRKVS